MPNRLSIFFHQFIYVLQNLLFLPITFIKRVLLGKDPVWREFFFDSWGFLPRDLKDLAKKKKNLWVYTVGGELTQMHSFCRLLKKEFPDYNLFLSTRNYHGFKLTSKMEGVDYVFFSPWDIKLSANRTLRYINPEILIIIEMLIAPLLFKQAYIKGYKTLVCSSFMRKGFDKHPTLKRGIALKFYNYFSYIGVKNEEDVEGYKKLGVDPEKIKALGDMKYDVDYFHINSGEKERIIEGLGLGRDCFLLIAGSTHPGEDEIIIDAYKIIKKELSKFKLILVPRFFSFIPRIERYLRRSRLNFIRKSKLKASKNGSEVIIVDTFGELPRLYGIASFSFIGSSLFSKWGGHNIIEPLIQSIPIFHGPYMVKDKEIVEELRTVWNGLEIRSSEELASGVIYLCRHPEVVDKIRNKCEEIVGKNKNSAQKHIQFIKEILGK
jgi:3-deoxy-D-manno-octulosonic-acid transferase